uniref:Capsid protein n=2 Tax=Bovine herpesvirus 4 TaxID=10385 RepID=A0A0F6N5A8_BHV4|nr:capsid protein [Bovine gammaherpesvirus 4]QJC19185.1 capsid protein [Bovine gammaherpesvirus 4]
MLQDRSIVISLTSRLFTDEISSLQEKIGCVLTVQDSHRLQNVQSLGLGQVFPKDAFPDYVQMYYYITNATLAILEEVKPDSIVLTRIDPNITYQIKNSYKPFFQWDSHSQLCVIPPIFGRDVSTVSLESNGVDIVFPVVVPERLANIVLQKLLLYNIYSKLSQETPNEVNMAEVSLYTTNISYLGRNYVLAIENMNPSSSMALLDDLAIYVSILSALLPKACIRLITTLMRHGQHELLDVFGGMVPPEIHNIDLNNMNIGDDMTRMGAFITYIQTLGSVFNLGSRLHLSTYSSDTNTATCWISS